MLVGAHAPGVVHSVHFVHAVRKTPWIGTAHPLHFRRTSNMKIHAYTPQHLEPVVALSLRAWGPVFVSIKQVLPPALYDHFYPDWRVVQKEAVESVCSSNDYETWVALDGETVAGFVALKLDAESKMGEIYMIAVDPDFQRRGVAATLTQHALDRMKQSGMTEAMVETGADPGHAPARATYEKMGFAPWPSVRYFKQL